MSDDKHTRRFDYDDETAQRLRAEDRNLRAHYLATGVIRTGGAAPFDNARGVTTLRGEYRCLPLDRAGRLVAEERAANGHRAEAKLRSEYLARVAGDESEVS